MTNASVTTGSGGRLMQLLSARGGTAVGAPTMVLQHREALIYTLGKAAVLEQLVMCQYLYAAFSMKDRDEEGLTPVQLDAVRRWRRELMHIAEQEMLHLALVQNLLTAVGAGSAFERPNFPLPPHAYPAGIRMELLPFNEVALRHFIYLERPEGLDMADQDALAAVEKAAPLPRAEEDEIGRGSRTSPRSASCIGRSSSASTGYRSASARTGCSSDRRRRRPRRATSGCRASPPSGTWLRPTPPSTRSSSRARAPGAPGARRISGGS